jgi:hypothetical protein
MHVNIYVIVSTFFCFFYSLHYLNRSLTVQVERNLLVGEYELI